MNTSIVTGFRFKNYGSVKHVAYALCKECQTEYTSDDAIRRAMALNDLWNNKSISSAKKNKAKVRQAVNNVVKGDNRENRGQIIKNEKSKGKEHPKQAQKSQTGPLLSQTQSQKHQMHIDGLLGGKVKHKDLGEGTVFEVNDKYVVIQFNGAGENIRKRFSIDSFMDYFIPLDECAKLFFGGNYARCTRCGCYCRRGDKLCNSCKILEKQIQELQMRCQICGNLMPSRYLRDKYIDKYCICKSCVMLTKNERLITFYTQHAPGYSDRFCLIDRSEMVDLYIDLVVCSCSSATTSVERENYIRVLAAMEERCPEVIDVASTRLQIDISNENKILYIHAGSEIGCKQRKHPIISATGVIHIDMYTKQYVNINYCMCCDKCFISNTEYQMMRDKFGVLYIKFIWVDEHGNEWTDANGEFAGKSPLALTGYTVDAKTGYNSTVRHEILKTIISKGVLSKTKVLDYLGWFIRFNGASPNKVNAVSKWKDDMRFVQDLDLEHQPLIKISSVKKW